MNTTTLVAAFIVVVSCLIWIGTQSNDTDWAGNRNQCVGECYEDWKAENGGTIATVEQTKPAALAATVPLRSSSVIAARHSKRVADGRKDFHGPPLRHLYSIYRL